MINYNADYVDEPLKDRLIKESSIEHISDKKLGYRIIENGVVLPCKCIGAYGSGGGIVSSDGFESGSICRGGLGASYEYDKNDVEYSDETVIYVGMFDCVWGHCLTDNLAFMWFFKSGLYEHYKDCKIIYLSPYDRPSVGFAGLLRSLDIDVNRFVRITKLMRFKRIVFPDKCFFWKDSEEMITCEYIALIDEIRNSVPASTDNKYEKIYLTRSKFAKNEVGEKKLERFFRRRGYTVVSPEKYTLTEQISMFKRCRYLAATEGSVSHNSMFMERGGNAIFINRGAYYAGYTFATNAVNDLNATFVSAHLSILANPAIPWGGPAFYYVSDNLLKYFGEETMLEKSGYWLKNFKDFKKYLGKYKYFDDMANRVCNPYYYSKVGACLQKYFYYKKSVFPYRLLFPYCLIWMRPFVKKLLRRK